MNSLRSGSKRRTAPSRVNGSSALVDDSTTSQSSLFSEHPTDGYFNNSQGLEMEPSEDDGGAAKSFKTKQMSLRRKNYKAASTARKYIFLLLMLFLGFFFMFVSVKDKPDIYKVNKAVQRLRQRLKGGKKFPQQQPIHVAERAEKEPSSKMYQRAETDKTYYEQLVHQKMFFTDSRHLPKLPGHRDLLTESMRGGSGKSDSHGDPFRRYIAKNIQEWEEDADDYPPSMLSAPFVDYTKLNTYKYVWQDEHLMTSDPSLLTNGVYPHLKPLGELMKEWPQDDIDHPPLPIVEYLMRFDFQNPEHVKAATRFRDAQLPFKMYNVPELELAREKWTDDYCAEQFDHTVQELRATPAKGTCQRSKSNYFAFFAPRHWNVDTMGPPPTIDTDLSFALWSKHARYADKVGLPPDAVHYYWQTGVPPKERYQPLNAQSFISKDLPSFSSRTNNFFLFNVAQQKGIQCRFGERGVVAATHYDAGRNMVAMITGAKRYILSPPKACSKLGVVLEENHPSFRHSMLNFAHLSLLNDDGKIDPEMKAKLLEGMSPETQEWLNKAKDAPSLSTVLKAGEVLYIPSHWFHYIISLQKSAQCNVRSGRETEGHPIFGGLKDVTQCTDK